MPMELGPSRATLAGSNISRTSNYLAANAAPRSLISVALPIFQPGKMLNLA
jgi:hypothetical protein